jgi:formyl-CoA transferase
MFVDPQFSARAMIEQQALADGTPLKVPAVVPKLSQTPGATRWLGPALGQHTDEVLESIGVTRGQIDQLRRDGAVL